MSRGKGDPDPPPQLHFWPLCLPHSAPATLASLLLPQPGTSYLRAFALALPAVTRSLHGSLLGIFQALVYVSSPQRSPHQLQCPLTMTPSYHSSPAHRLPVHSVSSPGDDNQNALSRASWKPSLTPKSDWAAL